MPTPSRSLVAGVGNDPTSLAYETKLDPSPVYPALLEYQTGLEPVYVGFADRALANSDSLVLKF